MKLIKKIPYFLLAFSLILFTFSLISRLLGTYFNRTACQLAREILAFLTSVVSFSIFEGAVLLSPFLVIITLTAIFKSSKNISKQFFTFVSFFLIIPSLYFLTIGISYKADSPFVSSVNINEDELICSAEIITKGISEFSDCENSFPDITEISDELARSYSCLYNVHGYTGNVFPRPKEILFSKWLSHMGTLAFYSFPTGEVNINTEIPDYMVPFTIAHEYAHYVGIASEQDANFMAFLACVNSNNGYIRYSGLLSGIEYLLSDIYKCDKEIYKRVFSLLPERAISDMKLYREYSKKYERGFFFSVSDELNSAHLDIWDKNGRHSYSGVSGLIADYINSSFSHCIKCSETTVLRSEKWDDLLYAGEKLYAVRSPLGAQKMRLCQ